MQHKFNNEEGIAPTIEHLSSIDFQFKEGNNIPSVYNKVIDWHLAIEHNFCILWFAYLLPLMSYRFLVIKDLKLFKMLQPENLNPYLNFSCTLTDIYSEFVVGMKSVEIMNSYVSSLSRDKKYKSSKVR